MTEVLQQIDLFRAPEGILEGEDIEIALRFLRDALADKIYTTENPLYGHTENPCRTLEELRDFKEFLNEITCDMLDEMMTDDCGESAIATSIADHVEQEVTELNDGERGCVTGEAHLFFERRKAILSLASVANQGANA